ncbi:hypothetical protein [Desulfosporosinus fructosivorans]|uniref:hypothetical protein n=1 Tax=Desulfosporosinus fructosivorans TaxID=2018669 RepID=UPI00130EEBFD|nr:hypothetical protein [Desulfosporosinus fructosivorans]
MTYKKYEKYSIGPIDERECCLTYNGSKIFKNTILIAKGYNQKLCGIWIDRLKKKEGAKC